MGPEHSVDPDGPLLVQKIKFFSMKIKQEGNKIQQYASHQKCFKLKQKQMESQRIVNCTPFNRNPEKAGVAILLAVKVDLKARLNRRDKVTPYLLKEKSNPPEIIIINSYACNTSVLIYIKQTLMNMKNQISTNIIVTGDLSTPLSHIDKSNRQKINKEI